MEYTEYFGLAATLLMMKEAESRIGKVCHCSLRLREVRCLECFQFTPLCRECWVESHKHQPFHWGYIWDVDKGYFLRHDISTVLADGYAIALGHDGEVCPNASSPLLMNIGSQNGIHATLVKFCGCSEHDKWRQCFDADLFPASVKDPQTCFTFGLLRHWQLETLQSKITAYDYIRALRRLTDNVFTGNVPVSCSPCSYIIV